MQILKNKFSLVLDENFESNTEFYGIDFFNSYNKLNSKRLFKEILNMLNKSIISYSKTWEKLKFKTLKPEDSKNKFHESCLELIFFEFSYIYNHIIHIDKELYNSEFLSLLDYVIEKSIEKETKIFSSNENLNYDEMWEARMPRNILTFNHLFIENNVENYTAASFYLFNLLINPLDFDHIKSIQKIHIETSKNEDMLKFIFYLAKDIVANINSNIIDRFKQL